MTPNLLCESPADHVRVVRFLRPDLRPELYQSANVGDTALYRDLRAAAIDTLPPGGTLVLNFGLVDWFPTAFYALLLKVLEDVRARLARVVVCCLPPHVREGFDLMGGSKLFDVHASEARAVAAAKQ